MRLPEVQESLMKSRGSFGLTRRYTAASTVIRDLYVIKVVGGGSYFFEARGGRLYIFHASWS